MNDDNERVSFEEIRTDFLALIKRAQYQLLQDQVLVAQGQRDRMRDALEWYLDFNNYVFRNDIEFNYAVVADGGERAREAIASLPPRDEKGTE